MTANNPHFDLEAPVRAARNAANVLEMVVETMMELKHPSPGAQVEGYTALLLPARDVDTLMFALYEATSAAQKAADAFDAACEEWTSQQTLEKAA